MDPAEWDSWLAFVEPWLRRNDLPPSLLHRQNLLAEIYDARYMSWSSFPVPFPRPVWYHERQRHEAADLLRICLSIDRRICSDAGIRTCKLHVASSVMLMAINPDARAAGAIGDSDLAKTQTLLEEVAHDHRELSSQWWLLKTLGKLKTVAYIRAFYYRSLPDTAALKYIEEADDIIRQMLSQSQYLPGFQSYAVDLAAAEDLDIGDFYRSAVKTSFITFQRWSLEHLQEAKANSEAQLPEGGQELASHINTWTQRAKARTTTNILGFNFTVPLGGATDSPTAQRLLEREMRLLDDWNTDTTMMGKLKMKKQWQDLRQEMLNDDALKDLVSVQQGYSISSSEIHTMFQWFQEDVTLVDFVEVGLWDHWDLLMVIYRNGKFIGCQPILDIKIKEVEDTRNLKKLAGLIKPLQQHTKPGEVIVICPVKALHRVLLHALTIGNEIFIERNPVVYCQSFTLLRLCFINRFQNGGSSSSRPVAYNPLRNEPSTAAAVGEVAQVLGTQVAEPDNLKTPKEDFTSKVADAPLIHFHGHVRFNDTEPLKHHLELAAIREDEEGNTIPLTDDEILTAKDVFSLGILPSAHITTISCKSARVRVTEANDLNIHRDDRTRFSKEFYTHLFEQGRTPKPDGTHPEILDMARAMQHAILKLRKESDGKVRAPYHWAGFILNGAWQIQNVALNESEI